jgi:DNA-binding CsgD family transcriptional regulator
MPSKCPDFFTPKEKEILKLFCFTSIEIAKTLNIKKTTVKMHTENILTKLQCKSKAAALFEAVKQDLIKLQEIRTKEL